jgi:SAM-dependent methyltransferase
MIEPPPACPASEDPYSLRAGEAWLSPPFEVCVREDEYSPEGFKTLLHMQREHFWYIGRHRFLYHALRHTMARHLDHAGGLRMVDLGGGCGGWVQYLSERQDARIAELALADASPVALQMAAQVLSSSVKRYQIDLLDLRWKARWDVVFLLDVLEHIPEQVRALQQIREALRPGGILILACPALQFFWSYNDVLCHHCRRYSRGDYAHLAAECGLEFLQARYFMFFLSPLLWLSRLRVKHLEPEQAKAALMGAHRVPSAPVNGLLSLVFRAETPLGWYAPFPWGTSVLGVFRRLHNS